MSWLRSIRAISTPRAEERLALVGVAHRLERLGPDAGRHLAALRRAAWPAVPADLLHLVVELQAVAVRVEDVGGVVDAGVELRRDRVDQARAPLPQEADRVADLLVAGELQA